MQEITREDLFWSIRKMELFVSEMDDDEFDLFLSGKPAYAEMSPPHFQLNPLSYLESPKPVVRLQFKVS